MDKIKCDYANCKNDAEYMSIPLWNTEQCKHDKHGNPHFTQYTCSCHANINTKALCGYNPIVKATIWKITKI